MYEKPWSANDPGCLIMLVDQSTSMEDTFITATGEMKRKCDALAENVNDFLAEAIKRCEKNGDVIHRMDIAVLGYGSHVGDALANIVGLTPVKAFSTHSRIEQRVVREFDVETAAYVEGYVERSVWLDPKAEGNTPMRTVMNHAYLLADAWARNHQTSFPPIIVNVTDGEATDGDPRQSVRQLTTIATADGHTLLFNCHLGNSGEMEIAYPGTPSELRTSNQFAPLLFDMSSVVPEKMRLQANIGMGKNIQPGAHGFVYNGGMQSVLEMLTIASSNL